MIEKIRIQGYRKFRDLTFQPKSGLNIFVGDNESGKSTLVEAIVLALTGKINGRVAQEELNPYWFNQKMVSEFFEARVRGECPSPPVISIELFFSDDDELQRLHGAHNSEEVTRACPGVWLTVVPNPEYANEIQCHFTSGTSIIPVEYYSVDWRSFADVAITARPRELSVTIINSKTVYSSGAIDYHLRQMLGDHLQAEEKAAVALAYRAAKEQMTTIHLAGVNAKMATLEAAIAGQTLALAMDQSSRTSWDTQITPHVADLPFSMAGQGQQSSVKVAIAMGRAGGRVRFVMIEEPENHLSYTSLNKLIKRIDEMVRPEQQAFITTHSSFVLNRLGVDSLLFVSDEQVSRMAGLSPKTVQYFRKLPGYDTLRLVLAERIVLVEGPSDEIIFERFYFDKYGHRPIDDGIDVVSMKSLSLARCLELASKLGKHCAALQDCDDNEPTDIETDLNEWLDESHRKLFVGTLEDGETLEPQLVATNGENALRTLLKISSHAVLLTWMKNNKTEAAIRIADSNAVLAPPAYMLQAMEFIHGSV